MDNYGIVNDFLNDLKKEGVEFGKDVKDVQLDSWFRISKSSTALIKSLPGNRYALIFKDFRTGKKLILKRRSEETLIAAEAQEKITSLDITRLFENYSKNTEEHPYLKLKSIKPYPGTAVAHGKLVIPFYNIEGNITTLQYISSDGSKLFKKNAVKKGSFFKFDAGTKEAYLCEGYATGYSLWEHLGKTVYVCGDAGNMAVVVKDLLSHLPHYEYIIAADNDKSKKINIGMQVARRIWKLHRIRYIFPKFPDNSEGLSDFNDLYTCNCEKLI